MRKLVIYLSEDEQKVILDLAQRERRDPRDQAALLIHHELERLGLLPKADKAVADPLALVGDR